MCMVVLMQMHNYLQNTIIGTTDYVNIMISLTFSQYNALQFSA